RDLNVGDNVTVSFTFKYSNLTYNNASRGIRIQGQGNITGWGNGAFNSYAIPVDFNAGSGEVNVSYRMIITSDHLLNSMWYINFRTDYITGGTISLKSLMIEKGNKKTTWTRALEDLDTKISENYSAINQTISGVNTTVGSMQTSISGHETRIGTAEGSINTMKEQIVLKVEKTDIYNIAGLVTKIDDRDASLIYTGTWSKGNDPAHYNTTYSHNSIANTSVKLTFDGVGVRWITSKNTFRGYADVKIDGAIVATNVDTYSATTVSNFVAFEKLGLTYGQHTIEIIVKGTKRAEAASPAVLIDYFEVLKEAQTQIDSAVSSISILSNQISSKVSSSDFGSLITQNVASVKTAIGQIGGNNLVKNGAFDFKMDNWSNVGTPQLVEVVDSTDSGYSKVLKVQVNGVNQGVMQTITRLRIGQTYTVSALINSQSGSGVIQLNNNGSYLSVSDTKNNSWNRYSITFIAVANSVSIQLGRGSTGSNGTYLFAAVKLEEGSNATAWNANPSELKSTSFEITQSYARFTGLDGSYTEFTPGTTGLKWHKNSGDAEGKDYHYLMATGITTISENFDATIQLGDEFKGKNFEVLVSVKSAKAANNASIELFSVAAGGKNIEAGTFRILGYMSSNYNPILNKYTSYIDGYWLLNDNTNLTSYPSFRGSMEISWIAIA
ncbi:Carbohydrate binding domain-containing protein, partial [Clostridium intestinale DSM 6191]